MKWLEEERREVALFIGAKQYKTAFAVICVKAVTLIAATALAVLALRYSQSSPTSYIIPALAAGGYAWHVRRGRGGKSCVETRSYPLA